MRNACKRRHENPGRESLEEASHVLAQVVAKAFSGIRELFVSHMLNSKGPWFRRERGEGARILDMRPADMRVAEATGEIIRESPG